MTEAMYEVTTRWGHFRLDEGAYRDYLQGKLWISAEPCPKHTGLRQEARSAALPADVGQRAIELKNRAAAEGFISTLQELCPQGEFPLPYKSYMADAGIEELNLSVRASNGLMRAGVKTLGRLKALMETERGIAGIRNLGLKSVREIKLAFLESCYQRLSNAEKAYYWQRLSDN